MRREPWSMSTVVDRIAEGFISTQGYVAGAVDEAMPLVSACDLILTKSDGMHFSIICIVDAEASESRRFEFGRESAKEILAACCDRYCGTLGGAKQPAVLVIIEVRRTRREEDGKRLREYSNRFFDRNAIHAFIVDCSTSTVVTPTRFSFLAGWGWRRFLRRQLRAPAA
jgi:hypothetical protein